MLTLNFKDSYINDWYSIGGPDEAMSNIRHADLYLKDYYYGCKTFEEAEMKMNKTVFNNLEAKNRIDLIIGGNLSNQLSVMNYAFSNNNKPFLGLYSACSTFTEGLIVASLMCQKKCNSCILTSSHELGAERQFRYPVEYEALKKCYTTSTITAAVGAIISNRQSPYKIVSATVGSIVDYDITDVYNMGAVMAPAAYHSIVEHLKNAKKNIKDYDLILTGDLGIVGVNILNKMLLENDNILSDKIYDAGSITYKKEQEKLCGGSGPTVLPFAFFNKFIRDESYRRILLVGTGALHSPTLVNQHMSIPAISHVVELEVNHD